MLAPAESSTMSFGRLCGRTMSLLPRARIHAACSGGYGGCGCELLLCVQRSSIAGCVTVIIGGGHETEDWAGEARAAGMRRRDDGDASRRTRCTQRTRAAQKRTEEVRCGAVPAGRSTIAKLSVYVVEARRW